MGRRLLVTLLATAVVAGCGGPADHDTAGGTPSGQPVAGTVTVLAAASLTESFTRIGAAFHRAHPGATVRFSFGGSSGLAQQITAGAPADVFASANPDTMTTVTDAGDAAGKPVTFARNQLVIAVPKGNPQGISTVDQLASPGRKVALCAAQVPCGAAAQRALRAAGVRVTPVSQEQDVKAALAKVKLGEVDAALVYRTDVRAAGDVDGIEFPASASAINDYPIVALRAAPNPSGGAAFVAYVRSEPARAALAAAGFQRP
ncbi:molybdate ABC transporter substrate-binding protein [Mangrovihabitans endophyticus]|uniref:Molybdate-binding protein n=1 Tax=Mangrovihabitans endophyticus TaxID=1751298 RepID=A0A8J3BWG0_9ACTN|nr:molybdate ABC transporter substrate-binding protein [Mangrovihabitans endophyticus]GGK80716.1 molybdate-binding protein [Mangrovihabitans endophyticus]